MKTAYRREVDGLRAVAVLPVILFHAGFETFRGGFVGVDVFFVISGFLITTVIVNEHEAGAFSLARFYERRARRILPALFLVMACCIPFAWAWLPPQDLKELSQSAAAVSTFVSNFLFWRATGYFETTAELKPLLHTWSLSVEEQFYLLFPPLFFVHRRWGRKPMVVLLSVATLVSLGAAQWGALHRPAAAFFLLPTRAWELGIGALAALYAQNREAPARTPGSLLSMFGLAAVIYSTFVFDHDTPFPGVAALVPTAGAALILLFARPDNWVGVVLGSRAFVGIGLISYSAYLWHQPLLAFARHRSVQPPGPLLCGGLALASLALAYCSWRFVEQPFRRPGIVKLPAVVVLAVTGTAFFLCFGLVGHVSEGVLFRGGKGRELRDLERRMRVNPGLDAGCEGAFTLSDKCRTNAAPDVLLWGDSLAMHLSQALQAFSSNPRFVQMTVSACGPMVGIAPHSQRYALSWSRQCMETNDKVIAFVRRTPSIKRAILSSSFAQYVNAGKRTLLRDGRIVEGSGATLPRLLETVRLLRAAGVEPTIISPTPQDGRNIGRCLLRSSLLGLDPHACDMRRSDVDAYQRRVVELLRRASEKVRVVWLHEATCNQASCAATVGSRVLYRDDAHLTYEGSAWIGPRIEGLLVIARAR